MSPPYKHVCIQWHVLTYMIHQIMQFESLVDGLIEGAADSFNFNNNSFLPEDARSALSGFVRANVNNINISGT